VNKDPKGRIAWCLSPLLSGVTTVYKVVGEGLRHSGWDVRAYVSGVEGSREIDVRFADKYCEILSTGTSSVVQNAREFIRRAGEQRIDVVFCTGQMFTLAAAPALPPTVRLITRCGVMTRWGYQLATANLERIDRIVVETPREYQDLIRDWGAAEKKCAIIPGGIDVQSFYLGNIRAFQENLRLVFLGRLDENQKAVMCLPKTVSRLAAAGVSFHLDIIGDGPDRERMVQAFARAGLDTQVTIHGTMRREDMLPFLQRAHIFVLPSRYEGVPWALLETMACGCVPVASRIAGTTDYIVEHGTNGILCTVGKSSEFAQAIMDLAADRARLESMSAAAVRTIHQRFTLDRVVKDHDELLRAVLAQEPRRYNPIPVTAIQTPDLPVQQWRRYVPQSVKNYVRTWAERFHRSV